MTPVRDALPYHKRLRSSSSDTNDTLDISSAEHAINATTTAHETVRRSAKRKLASAASSYADDDVFSVRPVEYKDFGED